MEEKKEDKYMTPDGKRIFKISFSEFSTFLNCPMKWYFSYLLRVGSDVSEELIFGSMVHKTIEDIVANKSLSRESLLPHVIKDNLKKELENIKDINFLKKIAENENIIKFLPGQCLRLIKGLDFHNRYKDYTVKHIEYKLENIPIVEFDDCIFVFKGYIDMVLQHKELINNLLFIDWKTSRKPWDIKKKLKANSDAFEQLGFYKIFYDKINPDNEFNIKTKFYNLPRESTEDQREYSGNLTPVYLEYLKDKLVDVCSRIREIKMGVETHLEKAKFLRKDNWCYRCNLNNEAQCNDTDEFGIVDANLLVSK